MNKKQAWFAVLTAVAASGHCVYAVSFADFSSTAGLTLNGSAVGNVNNGIDSGPVLRLAAAITYNGGTAFTTSPVSVSQFSTTFKFRITDPGGYFDGYGTGADGLTFTLQPLSDSELGVIGGSLAYGGISPSVAIEFDTWWNGLPGDPDSNHIGLDENGSLDSTATLPVAVPFDDGQLWEVAINYDGAMLTVNANGNVFSEAIDIAAVLGTSMAYVGFTGATGAAYGNHDIVCWDFQSIPETGSLVLGAVLGLSALGAVRFLRRGLSSGVE